ncbi:small subunit ribosomal protein S6e, putative [Babesia ovis]|uniref:Small subunit ribosomal protein S6e, putative n=1 Tax=Babesia ovis TaxID=5869 RepID=A0A9W5TAV7_BABOV|nr:small subunit ribosomal protein S6e, putative [Babesia ovis]
MKSLLDHCLEQFCITRFNGITLVPPPLVERQPLTYHASHWIDPSVPHSVRVRSLLHSLDLVGSRVGMGLDTLGGLVLLQHLEVGLHVLSRCLLTLDAKSDASAFTLDPLGSHEPLDLWSPGLVAPFNLAPDDVLADIILGAEVKEFADLRSPLGTEPAGSVLISETGDFLGSLLDNHQVEDGEVGGGDAAAHRLTAHLTGPPRAVALHSLLQQKPYTASGENTLHHGKSLLVVTTRYFENVALELVTERITGNLGSHTLFIKWEQAFFIVDLHGLLHTRVRVRQVELHLDHTPENLPTSISRAKCVC